MMLMLMRSQTRSWCLTKRQENLNKLENWNREDITTLWVWWAWVTIPVNNYFYLHLQCKLFWFSMIKCLSNTKMFFFYFQLTLSLMGRPICHLIAVKEIWNKNEGLQTFIILVLILTDFGRYKRKIKE